MFLDAGFGAFLAAASVLIGILILTGHGDFFLKGSGSDVREKMYDMEKFSRACGIAALLFGAVTGIDCLTHTVAAKIAYVAAIALIFAVLVVYIQKKCKKQ